MSVSKEKQRAPRNRTVTLTDHDLLVLPNMIMTDSDVASNPSGIINRVVNCEFEKVVEHIFDSSIDLLILDPPYNLDKNFNGFQFNKRTIVEYEDYLCEIFSALKPKLKNSASIYICGDWRSSVSIFSAAKKFFKVRNRITWEREKGRGALTNWKNCSEDIWFCTMSEDYTFNVDKVKLRRKVIAPYRDSDGAPKDWVESTDGSFRDTSPSNLWSDITIPFWSMPENTDHPTQKSEKLFAKLVLCSSNEGDLVLDPFLGSGTTAVVCRKLARKYVGIEINREYCLLAQKRIELARTDMSIQGYQDGVFWERNTLNLQNIAKAKKTKVNTSLAGDLFDDN